MKKLFLAIATIAVTAPLALSSIASASGVNYNNVISDAVFDNSSSMTASQINSFLNTFPNSCISPANGYSFADPTGYNPSDSFTYGGNVSAGTVIAHAAKAYNLNPQVLLTTMQKEQSIITGDSRNCSTYVYSAAMGYGCPDGGKTYSYSGVQMYVKDGHAVNSIDSTCVNKKTKVGFSRQIINAAWLLTFDRHRSEGLNEWHIMKTNWDNSDDLNFCYSGPMANTHGKKVHRCPSETSRYDNDPYIAYSGVYSYDSTKVTIADGATAALFHYTPHLHGQSLFYDVWVNTLGFGSTTLLPDEEAASNAIDEYYEELGGDDSVLGQQTGTLKSNGKAYWKAYENGYITGSKNTGYWESMGPIRVRWSQLDFQNGKLGYPTGPVTKTADGNGLWQSYQHGYIVGSDSTGYWESMKGPIRNRWMDLGHESGELGYAIGAVKKTADGNGLWQSYQNGYIVWNSSTGAWESIYPIRDRWVDLGLQNGELGYPTGPVTATKDGDGYWQSYQHGYIVGSTSTGYWESIYPIRSRWVNLGHESGELGYPIGAVNKTADGNGLWQQYQNGYIVWSQKSGAWESIYPIRSRWNSLGHQNGTLGYPTGPVTKTADGNGLWQSYQHGYIVYSSSTGAWESYGPIRSRWVDLGLQNGKLGYPTGPVTEDSGTTDQQYQNGTIYYSASNGTWVKMTS